MICNKPVTTPRMDIMFAYFNHLYIAHGSTPPSSTLFPYTTLFRSRRPHDLQGRVQGERRHGGEGDRLHREGRRDRKSTRLNSSHRTISYAVFCLKKKITEVTKPRHGYNIQRIRQHVRQLFSCTQHT